MDQPDAEEEQEEEREQEHEEEEEEEEQEQEQEVEAPISSDNSDDPPHSEAGEASPDEPSDMLWRQPSPASCAVEATVHSTGPATAPAEEANGVAQASADASMAVSDLRDAAPHLPADEVALPPPGACEPVTGDVSTEAAVPPKPARGGRRLVFMPKPPMTSRTGPSDAVEALARIEQADIAQHAAVWTADVRALPEERKQPPQQRQDQGSPAAALPLEKEQRKRNKRKRKQEGNTREEGKGAAKQKSAVPAAPAGHSSGRRDAVAWKPAGRGNGEATAEQASTATAEAAAMNGRVILLGARRLISGDMEVRREIPALQDEPASASQPRGAAQHARASRKSPLPSSGGGKGRERLLKVQKRAADDRATTRERTHGHMRGFMRGFTRSPDNSDAPGDVDLPLQPRPKVSTIEADWSHDRFDPGLDVDYDVAQPSALALQPAQGDARPTRGRVVVEDVPAGVSLAARDRHITPSAEPVVIDVAVPAVDGKRRKEHHKGRRQDRRKGRDKDGKGDSSVPKAKKSKEKKQKKQKKHRRHAEPTSKRRDGHQEGADALDSLRLQALRAMQH